MVFLEIVSAIALVAPALMTCTSIVWNPLQNGIGITKIFKIIFGLRKFLKSISYYKWDSQIFKIARSYNQKPAASFNMSNRWFCYTNSLFDQGLGDHKGISTTLNHFENFLIPFWILKIFCNPKIILKIFVIQIQFWNWFQTIEVQVIRIYEWSKLELMKLWSKNDLFFWLST